MFLVQIKTDMIIFVFVQSLLLCVIYLLCSETALFFEPECLIGDFDFFLAKDQNLLALLLSEKTGGFAVALASSLS